MMEQKDYQKIIFNIFSIVIAMLSIIYMGSSVSNLIGDCFTKPRKPQEIKGLVGYWKFDGNTEDSSGHNNNGKWVGNELYKDGIFAKAAYFDGTSNYVTISHSISIDVGRGAFSFGAWVNSKGKENGKNQHFLNKRTGGLQGLFWDLYLSGKVENINAEVAGGSLGNPQSNMIVNNWHHILFTRDDFKLTTVYIDGKPIVSKNIYGNSSNTHSFNIGNLTEDLSQGFIGLIDEVVIYNRELTKKEVYSLYLSGKGR